MATGAADERTLTPFLLPAGDQLEHVDSLIGMLRRHKTGAYMFARTNDGGIQGIEVHFARFFDIANNHRSLEKVYVLHRINDTGCIVQIPEGGVAVPSVDRVNNVDCRTRRTEVGSATTELHIMPRVLTRQNNVACSRGNGILDERFWKEQAPVFGRRTACPDDQFPAGRNGVGNSDLRKRFQGCLVNTLDFGFGERLVPTARLTRPDCPFLLGKRHSAQCPSGCPAAHATGTGRRAIGACHELDL